MTSSIKILLVAIIALATVVKYAVEASCISEQNVNGCSAPFRNKFPYARFFKPACNRHDVCYRCGSHYSWPRKDCDSGFYNDMIDICNAENTKRSITRNFKSGLDAGQLFDVDSCGIAASSFWSAVRFAGIVFYRKNSPDWCKEHPCVRRNGLPNLS